MNPPRHTSRWSVRNRWQNGLLALVVALAPVVGHAQGVDADVRAVLSMEPERVYAGQNFALTLTIRAHGVMLGRQFNLDGLPDSGLLELDTFQELPARREQVDATLVDVRQFRCRAYARHAGSIELAPTLQYERLTQERTWFGVTTFQTPRRLALLPLAIQVHPLPAEGRPADFSGAVGRFTFTVEATPRAVAPGDLVTLVLTLQGDGRMDALTCPPLGEHTQFRVYPPRVLTSDKPDVKRFEQIVIPESTNAVATPPVHFTYFDPLVAAYRTLTAGSLPLTVHARTAAPSFTPYRPDPPPATESSAPPVDGAAESAGQPTNGQRAATWWRASGSSAPPMLARALAGLCLVAGLAYLGAAGLRHRRRQPIAGIWRPGVVLLAVGVAGLGVARAFEHRAQAQLADYTLREAVTCRLAPSTAALALAELPAGAAVQVMETWGSWRKIRSEDQRGWVPAAVVAERAAPP